MLHQLVLNWGCAKAMNNVNWDHALSFSQWAGKQVAGSLAGLPSHHVDYMDTTALNQYTIAGILPEGKASLLKAIDDLLQLA